MNSARSVFDLLDPNSYGLESARRLSETLIPRRFVKPSRKIMIAVVLSIAVVASTGLFFYQARAEFAAPRSSEGAVVDPSSGVVYLGAKAAAVASAVAEAKSSPILEMHIANNGLVLLEGARVVSLSGGRIRVEMKWGSESFSWLANTNSNTKFFASNGEKTTLANIQVGDTLTVSGMLTNGGAEPSMDAVFVREE